MKRIGLLTSFWIPRRSSDNQISLEEMKTTSQVASTNESFTAPSNRGSAYKPPQTGWLSKIPSAWVPYAQLMRLDRPHGFWYFYLPHLFGSLYTAIHLRAPLFSLLTTNFTLVIGTIIMRGATCTWNDTIDAPFDRQVARTRNRPIARGAVSANTAHVFTAIQTFLSLSVLAALPSICFLYAVPAIAGWVLYPFAKRVTYYPQVVLGFPMAWGIFMGSAAMGMNPLHILQIWPRPILKPEMPLCALYAANVLWTLLYEIIYSHQDAKEDTTAGVKNIVLLYHGHTKPLLVKLAIGQVLFLAIVGYLETLGVLYWVCTVFGAAVTSVLILRRVRLDVPEDCAWWFKQGCCGLTG